MVAHSGFEEAYLCLAVCDLVSSGPLLQQSETVLVGRPEVHTGLERRNWRLQDGRVRSQTLYACFNLYSLSVNNVLRSMHQIGEAGTMNIFLHWINEDGGLSQYKNST